MSTQLQRFKDEVSVSKTARPRITWVDYAKGVGIFLVVFGHVLRGLHSSQIITDSPAYFLSDSAIYSFHMPLFFLLSGLFANRQVERKFVVFVREKLATIAYPYLVWSVLQTFIQVAISRHTNHKTSLNDLLGILIEPIMQFWFLYALFLISLLYYLLRRCGLGSLGVLAVFVAFWATDSRVSLGRWSPLYATRRNGLYYALGSVLERYGWIERFDRAQTPLMALTAILGYCVVIVWAAQLRTTPVLFTLIVTLCGIAASIALAVLLGRVRGTDFIRVMGVYSLEIYVAHTIALAGVRIFLQKALEIQDTSLHLMLGTIGGIVLPLMLSWLCRRYHAEPLFRFPKR